MIKFHLKSVWINVSNVLMFKLIDEIKKLSFYVIEIFVNMTITLYIVIVINIRYWLM